MALLVQKNWGKMAHSRQQQGGPLLEILYTVFPLISAPGAY